VSTKPDPDTTRGGIPRDALRFYAVTDDEKLSADWLLNPANVVSQFRDGTYCRLCDSNFHGDPVAHVAGHEASLSAWEIERKTKPHDPELEAQVIEAVRLHVERGRVASISDHSRCRGSSSSGWASKTSAMDAQNTFRGEPAASADRLSLSGIRQCASPKNRRERSGVHRSCPYPRAHVSA